MGGFTVLGSFGKFTTKVVDNIVGNLLGRVMRVQGCFKKITQFTVCAKSRW